MVRIRARRLFAASAAAVLLLGVAASVGQPATAATAPAPKVVTVAVDLPLQGASAPASGDTVKAIQLYLDSVGGRAGKFRVKLRVYDDATAASAMWDAAKCRANAAAHVRAKDEVVVIGPFNSGCAKLMVPVLNRDRTGPLTIISHATTNPGLTKKWDTGEPTKYYPTRKRNYARIIATDEVQGVAVAKYAATTLRVRKVFVLNDNEVYGRSVAASFSAAAKKSKISVVGSAVWAATGSNAALFRRIKASGADAVYLGGTFDVNGAQLLKDKVAVLGDNTKVKVIADDGFTGWPQMNAMPEAQGVFISYPGVDLNVLNSRRVPAKFLTSYKARYGAFPSSSYALYGVAAVQEGLAAIAKSDGTRRGVQKVIFSGRGVSVPASVSLLGTAFGVDPRTGDVTVKEITVEVIKNGTEQRVSVVTIR
jgi:branched-chain amino acid transport system substrate-binding protein